MGRMGSARRPFPRPHNPSHAGRVPRPPCRPGRARLHRPDRPQPQETTWRTVPLSLRYDALSRPSHGRTGLVGIVALFRLRIRSLGHDDYRGPTPPTGTRSTRDRPASSDPREVPDRTIRSGPGLVPRIFSEQCATGCGWESVSWRALQRARLAEHRAGTNPAGRLTPDPQAPSWCGHQWSPWQPLHGVSRDLTTPSTGLYRIRGDADDTLLYVGQGVLPARPVLISPRYRKSDTDRARYSVVNGDSRSRG